jgi:hypothetical protein
MTFGLSPLITFNGIRTLAECLMANIRYQNVIQCHSASETSACHSLPFNAITKKANG